MPRFVDLSGKRFGRWLVLSRAANSKKQTFWDCRCDCGNKKNVQGGNLCNGTSKSCGCLKKEQMTKQFYKNIINKRFGKLVAIKRIGLNKKGSYIWEFKCDCGKMYYNTSTRVVTGHSKSCGCLRKEYATINWGGKNSPKWNFNKTYEERRGERKIEGYNEWRRSVYAKFNWRCLVCNTDKSHGKYKLNAHHLESYQYNKELRCDVNNGVTMCHECHVNFHKKYGQVTNTKDFENYLNERNNNTIQLLSERLPVGVFESSAKI